MNQTIIADYDNEKETRWTVEDKGECFLVTLDKTTQQMTAEKIEYSDEKEDWETVTVYNAIETKMMMTPYLLVS